MNDEDQNQEASGTSKALCDNDLIFALSINAEEEIEYSERLANWAEIKALVEEDAHEKRKLIFSPGVSQGPAKLSRPMDANISNRFEKLREGVDANDDAEEQEEESVSRSSKRVNVDDDSEEPSLRAVRKQRLTSDAAASVTTESPNTDTHGESSVKKTQCEDGVKNTELSDIKKAEKCICPCCGELRVLNQTFGPKIFAIVIAACRDFAQVFKHNRIKVGEGGNSFHVCAMCRKLAASALHVAIEKHPNCESFVTSKRSAQNRAGSDQYQPKVKLNCGKKTLVGILEGVTNLTVHLEVSNLNLSPEPIVSSFKVGNVVEVARRKQPGVNEEGGVAEIMEVNSRRGNFFYRVRYVLDNREENELDDSIMKLWVSPAGRPTRSTQSSQQAEENEIERLRYQIAAQENAHKDELKRMKWQLRREQDRSKQLQIDLKQAATDQRSALADLEHERIMRQIDLEQMSQKAIEIAQFAVAATTEAAAKEHNAKVEEILAKNAKSKQIHEQKVKDLKERATKASAELHRLQSNVATMLEETKAVCESQRVESQECIERRHREELGRLKSAHRKEKKQLDQEKLMANAEVYRLQYRAAVEAQKTAEEINELQAKHQAEVAAQKEKLQLDLEAANEREKVETLFDAAVALGISLSDARLRPNTGTRSSSVSTLGVKEKRLLANTAMKCISSIVEAAAPGGDIDGMAKLISNLPEFNSLFSSFSSGVDLQEVKILKALEKNVLGAFGIFSQQKNRQAAQQILSLYPSTDLSIREVARRFSEHSQIAAGSVVLLSTGKGKTMQYAIVEQICGDSCEVTTLLRDSLERRSRYNTTLAAAASAVEAALPDDRRIVSADKVRCVSDVHCTEHAVKNALRLQAEAFPGAIPGSKPPFQRRTISEEGVNLLIDHINDSSMFPQAEASRKNALKGLELLRSLPIRQSYARFKEKCRLARLKAMRWEDYLSLLSSKRFGSLTLLNCVCTYCRTLLHENMEELRELIGLLHIPESLHKSFIQRVDWLQRYLGVDYSSHLQLESPDANLCVRFALSTANDPAGKAECEHGFDESGIIRPSPQRFADVVFDQRQREPHTDDWNAECGHEGCQKSSGKFLLCDGCAETWCRDCIDRTARDVDDTLDPKAPLKENTGWCCRLCQAERDHCKHHNDNPRVNDMYWLEEELMNAEEIFGVKREAVDALPHVTESEGDEFTEEDNDQSRQNSARSGFRQRLRGRIRNLERLRGHKVRTYYFARRKQDLIRSLDFFTAFEMKDYSGKLETRKSKQGTSEGLGPKLSNHGSIFVFRNPPASVREQFTTVDWASFPPASEDCYVQVNVFAACDDSKQSAFHMGSTMEVTYSLFKKSFPWISKAIPFSDNCGDYHSTAATLFNHEIGRLTGIFVVRVEHSEAGEGKGEVDVRFGIWSRKFNTTLANENRLCAGDLFHQMDQSRGRNDFIIQTQINRTMFRKGTSGAIPKLSESQAVEYLPGGGIRIFEVGNMGHGTLVTAEELRKFDHYGLMEAESTGSKAIQTSVGPMQPSVRKTNSIKSALADEKSQKEEAMKVKRQARNDEKAVQLNDVIKKHAPASEGRICAECNMFYKTEVKFDEHKSKGRCQLYVAKQQRRRKGSVRSSKIIAEAAISDRKEAAHDAETEELAQLATVRFTFTEGSRMIVEDAEQRVIVKSVSREDRDLAAAVLVGYIIFSVFVDGIPLESPLTSTAVQSSLAAATVGHPVQVSFGKPLPPMPVHGFARKHLRVESRNVFTEDQISWLESYCARCKRECGSLPRAAVVWRAMRQVGGDLHVDSSGAPFLLTESSIFEWLKRQYFKQKSADVDSVLALAAGEENESETEESDSDDSRGGRRGSRSTGRGRSRQSGGSARASSSESDDEMNDAGASEDDYRSWKVPELKEELKKRGLAVSGNKDDLIQRLMDERPLSDDDDPDYSSWTVSQLKEELKIRDLAVSGLKLDLVERLRESDN